MIDWLKKLFGFAKGKISESVNIKHQIYLYLDGLLFEIGDKVKNKSSSEIDSIVKEKREQLRTYMGEV